MKYEICYDPYDRTGYDAGYDQYRKIYENLQIGNDGGSYEYLTQVVSYTACYRNSCDGEYTGFLKQEHSKKAQQGSGEGVHSSEKAIEQKSCDDDSYYVYGKGVSGAETVKRSDHNDIGDAQFNARYRRSKGYQSLYI